MRDRPEPTLTTVYRCADGAGFPVTWTSPEAARMQWARDGEHHPTPLPPLEAAIWHLGRPARERAFAEAGLLVPHMFHEHQTPQGYLYDRTTPLTEAEQASQQQCNRQKNGSVPAGFTSRAIRSRRCGALPVRPHAPMSTSIMARVSRPRSGG